MKAIRAIILACSSILLHDHNCFANDVTVTKTFAHGNILEYDLVANPSNLQAKIRCTINKVIEAPRSKLLGI